MARAGGQDRATTVGLTGGRRLSGDVNTLDTQVAEIRRAGSTALVFVRHARTAWNAGRRFLGRTDVPLDAEGRRQASELASRLHLPRAAVYSSPLSRARETSSLLGSYRVVPELAELDQGALEGLDAAEAIRRHPEFFEHWSRDPATAPTPGGETLDALRARALGAVLGIAAQHPGEAVVVVSHQMVGSALGCHGSGDSLGRWRDHRLPNVGIKLFEVQADALRCVLRRVVLVEEVDLG
jgi:broad specificity phosphatase PhoE